MKDIQLIRKMTEIMLLERTRADMKTRGEVTSTSLVLGFAATLLEN